ncbi:hypothetical protein DXG01_015268 [Tephrocybe rancida]|nr:hypothetical protein DXG01_015268 [Tephrocybe rancida]
MKFATFFTLASLSALALGADIDTLRADGAALTNSCTTFGTQVAAFPTARGAGTLLAVQGIATSSAAVVAALSKFSADAATLVSPISEADGIALVETLTPVGNGYIVTLQNLRDRKAAIEAITTLPGLPDALVLVQQALALVKTGSDAFKAAMAQFAFTGAALDGWNALADSVINEEVITINFYNSV